ncbi:MAG: hypothetical protein AAGG68_00965 [Bacteroidota bacterium]
MENQRLSRLLSILGVIALFCLLFRLWVDNKNEEARVRDNFEKGYQAYQKELDNFRKNAPSPELPENIDEFGTNNVRANNFEGPEVSIEALEFHGKPKKKGSSGVLDYSYTSIAFDPDHPRLGLPDVEVEVSPVQLYRPEKRGVLSKVRSFLDKHPPEHRPYRVYYKEIEEHHPDSTAAKKFVEMQLWLTEFKVTISAKPDRKKKGQIPLSQEEKEKKLYPRWWYGGTNGSLTAKELEAEPKNRRYGNLKLWMRIKPNNSPWYVNNELGRSKKPEMAIGAVYCMELDKKPKDIELDEISTSVEVGKELALYSIPEYDSEALGAFPQKDKDYASFLGSSISRNDTSRQSIWNKDYFVKVYLKNFGSWKEGFFGNRKYDDQLTYTFMMPILVEGSWDIHAPYEMIPTWSPEEPYYKELKLVPDWGMKGFGKAISYGLLTIIGFGILLIFFPQLLVNLLRLFTKKS